MERKHSECLCAFGSIHYQIFSYMLCSFGVFGVFYCKLVCGLKARLHCKSLDQIGRATWPSSLVGQLKSPGVDDKPSSFIASNEADRLCHPVQLNVGKRQRKADRLRSFRFFRPQFSSSTRPPPNHKLQSQDPRIHVIASSSNIFENFNFSKILDEDAISRIREFCDCSGRKQDDENRGRKNLKQILKTIDRRNRVTKIMAEKIENIGFSSFEILTYITFH